jgi:aspartate kinase
VSLTGSQSGIITDEAHADARVVEVRPDRVRRSLDEGHVVIVAGFQGVSREREVTTLGRGGSDTTAVVLAAALNADHCEICSDVDGIWSADPRVVPGALQLDELSLEEALALAQGGARVLFEDAVRYARDHGVTLQASTTFGPGAGTRLASQTSSRVGAAAVTGDDQLVRVRMSAASAAAIASAGARVRRRVGDLLHVDIRNAHGGLGEHDAGAIAVVTAVGSALGENLELVQAGDEALVDFDVVARGAAGDAAWWQLSDPGRIDDAVRALHRMLVRTP